MKRDIAEMKRAFLQEMGELFDQSMASLEEMDHPTLTDIEDAVLKLRHRAGQRVAEMLVEQVGEARPVPGPLCPRCGEEMHYKWSRQRTVETRVGAIRMWRSYFSCERCGAGFSPLDHQLELEKGPWSEGLAREVVRLCGEMPYKRATAVVERLARVQISASSAWRLVQAWGERFGAVLEAERRWGGVTAPAEVAERMGVAMDGGMIHIRGEGWKELKVGCLFAVGRRVEFDPMVQEPVELGYAQTPTYVAHLGGPEEFGKKLWAEAQRRGWERAQETEALGDGAPWIWNLVHEHFYDSQQVVDWFHATEHLGVAMRCLFGEGNEAGKRWYQRARRLLYQGHARGLARELEENAPKRPPVAEDLRREVHYFWHNHRRMQYMAMREEGWCIGSGVVESGVKQYKDRFARSGMRWTRPGAERMILIRSAVLSNQFTNMWQKAKILPLT